MSKEQDEIIANCQKGNKNAQQQVYTWLAPKMYAVCLQYTRNKMEAEDCLQDSFVKVFTKIESYQFKGSFEGWVRRIVINTIIESFRKQSYKTEIYDIDEIKNIQPNEVENITSDMHADELHHIIMLLPHQYRIVFTLYAIEGYTHDEISQKLGISVGTSKSNLSRARKWLQNKLENINPSEYKKYVTT